ncbi:MAG: S-layer homology domain-containing protein [Firmicutes bacterium]|nr:S-layer homology domain-containing protein [Bacillota bacterium]
MKRVISVILVLTFLLSTGMTTVFAYGNENRGCTPLSWANSKNRKPAIMIKNVFIDIEEIPWARQAIEKMKLKGLIKGYGDGRYAPRKAVTKLESIIMALRIMGWEEEAKSIRKLPKQYKGKKVGQWAYGYVAVAYQKGLLDNVDLMYFDPQAPAARHEVAKYVIRALGYEDEADEYMNAKLPFVDAAAVPQGSVGYVYLVNDMGLMQGDDLKRFNPMGTLTRAEMAVLFQRLDRKVDSDIDEDEYVGEVHRVYRDRITLKVDGQLKSFEVEEDDVIVYDRNSRIGYWDIKRGSTVLVELEDDEVVYIEVIDKDDQNNKIISKYTGTIKDIEKSNPRSLTINMQKMQVIFEVIDKVQVHFKDGKGSFNELKVNDNITVVVDNKNRARRIYVKRKSEGQNGEEIEGFITSLDLFGNYHITIDNTKYRLSKKAEVVIDGEKETLKDLTKGMRVEAILRDDYIVSVHAKDAVLEIEGEIKDIDDDEISIKKENGNVVTYGLAEDLEIEIGGKKNMDLEDLAVGDVGEFEIVNNVVVRIDVDDQFKEVEGIITEVDEKSISIEVYDKTEEYKFANLLVIDIEGYNDTLSNLEKGMEAKLKVRNGLVYGINAKDHEFEVEAEIYSILQIGSTTKLTLTFDKQKVTYEVSDNAEIDIEDVENADVFDLKVGQEGEFEVVNRTIIKMEIDD